jgi:hypothetical protein
MKAGKILPRKNARNTEKKAESGNPPPLRFGATRAETNKTGRFAHEWHESHEKGQGKRSRLEKSSRG